MNLGPQKPVLYVCFRMGSPKPYLQAACFCERVIIDREDQSASVIRILGKMDVRLPKNWPDNLPLPEINVKLFVSFASADYEGKEKVSIVAINPDNKRSAVASSEVTLAPNQNSNLNVNIAMGAASIGVHWFEIYWADNLEAKVPLLIGVSKTLPEVPNFGKQPDTKAP